MTIYAFVGQDVSSPALTSAGTTLSRVAYGVALPVSGRGKCRARHVLANKGVDCSTSHRVDNDLGDT
jgi:hypothetical protein